MRSSTRSTRTPSTRSSATPRPGNARSDDRTTKPTARDLYDRTGRRASPTKPGRVSSRYKPTRSVSPSDSANRSSRTRLSPRTANTRGTASVTGRYANPQPTARPHRAASRTTGRVPGAALARLSGARGSGRVTTRITTGYYGGSYGGYYGSGFYSWWDPCQSWYHHLGSSYWMFGFGGGCGSYASLFSVWMPWYCSNAYYWPAYHHRCWWNSWTSVCWSPSRYWWYPTTVYCPTYLYVPSSAVVVESGGGEELAADAGAAEPAPAAGSAAELAAKYVELGDFYFKAGRFSDAADAYARARTYAPDDAALHFVLADAAFAVGDYHFAAFLIAEGLRLDPTLATAEVDKRDFYGDPKLFDEQMAALDKYLTEKPYDASAHLVRAYNLRFSDRSAAAIVAFQRVLEIAPDHRAARIFLEVLQPGEAAPGSPAPAAGKDR